MVRRLPILSPPCPTLHASLAGAQLIDQFRNSYDSDNTTFVSFQNGFGCRGAKGGQQLICQSPQGKLHQVEYALEAVKQGSAAIGLRSKTHAILLTLKVSSLALSSGGSTRAKLIPYRGQPASWRLTKRS